MQLPARHRSLWAAFVQTQAEDPTPRFLEAFHFDDNERSANSLAQLVLKGQKWAGAALLWSYEHHKKRIPQPGDLSIVTDFSGNALCIIETRRVDVVPFDKVSVEFAALEGEGDGTLVYWHRVHEAYFGRECKRIGRTPERSVPVICERFEVVFPSFDVIADSWNCGCQRFGYRWPAVNRLGRRHQC